MKVCGELEKAQLEKLSADPTGDDLYEGRVWINTTDNITRYYDGSAVRSISDNELIGVSAGDADLGTFTGEIISNNVDVKTALQELETTVESGAYGANTFKFQSATVKETDSTYIDVFTTSIDPVYTPRGIVLAELRFEAMKDAIADVLDLRVYINGVLWQAYDNQTFTTTGVWEEFSTSNLFSSGLVTGPNSVTIEFRVDGPSEDGMSIRNMDMRLFGG